MRAIRRDSLPAPLAYLSRAGLLVSKPRAESAIVSCPAHKADTPPSLWVSLIDGHWRCRLCRARGRDVLALHRLFTGRGFFDAVLDLGARFDD